ncbi:bzip transcription factor 60-like [Anaeramoeba flamelloides]|uniref:Bzip transcription factor 60-like n=1 Tax=Anaeramoeba flamelloides TaxID=1746091 RepID=A0AAV7YLN8_9EUKA|nr:bzip transcription factor 60-like [Anaeramoeba flamelloides]
MTTQLLSTNSQSKDQPNNDKERTHRKRKLEIDSQLKRKEPSEKKKALVKKKCKPQSKAYLLFKKKKTKNLPKILSQEQKKQRKKARNRENSRRFRERKKVYVKQLESETCELKTKNISLQQKLDHISKENYDLKIRIQQLQDQTRKDQLGSGRKSESLQSLKPHNCNKNHQSQIISTHFFEEDNEGNKMIKNPNIPMKKTKILNSDQKITTNNNQKKTTLQMNSEIDPNMNSFYHFPFSEEYFDISTLEMDNFFMGTFENDPENSEIFN